VSFSHERGSRAQALHPLKPSVPPLGGRLADPGPLAGSRPGLLAGSRLTLGRAPVACGQAGLLLVALPLLASPCCPCRRGGSPCALACRHCGCCGGRRWRLTAPAKVGAKRVSWLVLLPDPVRNAANLREARQLSSWGAYSGCRALPGAYSGCRALPGAYSGCRALPGAYSGCRALPGAYSGCRVLPSLWSHALAAGRCSGCGTLPGLRRRRAHGPAPPGWRSEAERGGAGRSGAERGGAGRSGAERGRAEPTKGQAVT
jgi:hypothetical protein